jgi:hypothetical protein
MALHVAYAANAVCPVPIPLHAGSREAQPIGRTFAQDRDDAATGTLFRRTGTLLFVDGGYTEL